MDALPALEAIQGSPHSSPHSPLAIALETLFEHSPILVNLLEPQLNAVLKLSSPLASHTELIDTALSEIAKWDLKDQSEFISGHPRIGESKNLSKLSASEQGTQSISPTPPEVLARLAHLNACYEVVYPGLRYITFVNGRDRAAIAEEMESVLGFVHSTDSKEPAIDTMVSKEVESEEWIRELNRAIDDVGRIAKSRLRALGSR
jgi:2-oxo-4-hydroxy-4-carboxy--5-ureidoimidazoline (OHCU) decarboxylase